MAFHIRDEETDVLVRELARKKRIGLTEAVKIAAAAELKREQEKLPLYERIRHLQVKGAEHLNLSTDKAFFDSLSDEED